MIRLLRPLGIPCLLLLAASTPAADWQQFRGPGGSGVSPEKGLPVHWGPAENVRWKADLPGRGVSSPVVAGGRVYVTACSGPRQDRLHVLCFEAATGKRLWHRQFWATGNTMCNPKTCMAAPTPATDGRRVYALFATGDLACLDRDGNLLWYRALAQDYPQITNQVGMAASPVLCGEVLLLPMENAGESFAAGLDIRTGRNRWKVPLPRDINWATPLVLSHDHRRSVLFSSPHEVTAFDPETGQKLWTYQGKGPNPIPSPVAADGLVILPDGVALRPPEGKGRPEVVWTTPRLHPAWVTPLCYRGRVYVVNSVSTVLCCADLRTGKVLWKHRLRGEFSASAVAADGKLYFTNEEGTTTILEAGDRPRVLATNKLEGPMLATPAIADGAIFFRSERHLFCVSGKSN